MVLDEKLRGHRVGNVNVSTKCHGNPSWDISHWTKVADQPSDRLPTCTSRKVQIIRKKKEIFNLFGLVKTRIAFRGEVQSASGGEGTQAFRPILGLKACVEMKWVSTINRYGAVNKDNNTEVHFQNTKMTFKAWAAWRKNKTTGRNSTHFKKNHRPTEG